MHCSHALELMKVCDLIKTFAEAQLIETRLHNWKARATNSMIWARWVNRIERNRLIKRREQKLWFDYIWKGVDQQVMSSFFRAFSSFFGLLTKRAFEKLTSKVANWKSRDVIHQRPPSSIIFIVFTQLPSRIFISSSELNFRSTSKFSNKFYFSNSAIL